MGRRRKPGNDHLPGGVYPSRGWLFWKDPKSGDWHKLGKEWDRAARDKWVELSAGKSKAGTVADMLDAFMVYRRQLVREKKLAARTFTDNEDYARNLKLFFGAMPYPSVNGRHCASYLEKRTWQPKPRKGVPQPVQRAPVRANKELSLLSSAYTWAMTSPDFPLATSNPCYGVKRNPTHRSERCPELWEIEAAKAAAPPLWAHILDLAYICGKRGVEIRMLPKRGLQLDGLHVIGAKNGPEVIIEWSAELYGAVLGILSWSDAVTNKRHVESPYVILAKSGGPYTPHGWKTTMYKIVRAAIADPDNPLQEPFSFHHLRARSATDEEELYGTSPQNRLGHTRRSTTDIYMRGRRAKKVKPLPLQA